MNIYYAGEVVNYYYAGEIKWNEDGEKLVLEVPGFEEMPLRHKMNEEGMDDWELDMFLSFAEETYSYKLAELRSDTEKSIPIPLSNGEELYDKFIETNIDIIHWPIKKILAIKESIPLILELNMNFGQKTLHEVEEAEKKFEETKIAEKKLPYQFNGVVEEDELKEEECYEKYKDVWKERLDKKYANETDDEREILWDLLRYELSKRNKR